MGRKKKETILDDVLNEVNEQNTEEVTVPTKNKKKTFKVKYTWYNMFGERVDDCETFKTEEEAKKFKSLFPKGERIELHEVFYRLKNAGIRI